MTGYVRHTRCRVVRCTHLGCKWVGVLFGVDRQALDMEGRLALVRHLLGMDGEAYCAKVQSNPEPKSTALEWIRNGWKFPGKPAPSDKGSAR